jgi:hypothetical protein
MIFTEGAAASDFPYGDPLRAAISAAYRADETATVESLLPLARLDGAERARTDTVARRLVAAVREGRGAAGLDAFLAEYELTTQEGVVLMCLAEALLRIPDADTADRLIRDKIGAADWQRHLGHSSSLFVNASTWGLMLTGRMVRLDREDVDDVGGYLGKLVARSGEPIIRQAMTQAMRIMGRQFVLGRTIDEALSRAAEDVKLGYCHSFDMLGEAARTRADAERYFAAYQGAIGAIGTATEGDDIFTRDSVSVKLSALHPRFEMAQRERVMAEPDLGRVRGGLPRRRPGGLAGLRPRGAGLPEARPATGRLDRRPGPKRWPAHPGAAGQGRLLGFRDQECPGAGPGRLPGVHPQGRQRRLLPGLCAPAAGRGRGGLRPVRQP